MSEQLAELQAMRDEPLHPDLVPWYEVINDMPFVHHPLVVSALPINGLCNRAYLRKKELLAEALADRDWHSAVFLHERGYRLTALIEYVIGEDEDGHPFNQLGAWCGQDLLDLVADVWVDSENIGQMIEDWRILFGDGTGFFLGTYTEQLAFAALPDPIRAYRAGIDDGDWSWTTDKSIALFFARRFQKGETLPVMTALIPKADCFGYLTRRGEAELLVRVDENREVSEA